MGKKSIMRMLLTLSLSQIACTLLLVILFGVGAVLLEETGAVLSPRVISENVEAVRAKAAKGELEEAQIPEYIEYAELSADGGYLRGSVEDPDLIREVKERGKISRVRFMNTVTYEYIGGEREGWILGYKKDVSQFSDDFLRRLFPSADLTIVAGFFLAVAAEFWIVLRVYRNRLNRELDKITNIKETILSDEKAISDLSSPLKEINDILDVLKEMEKTVKESKERQLRQARLLEDSIRALTHDIQTPATVVSGNLELLEDTGMNEKQKEFTAYAREGITRISEYVEELKALVRMEQQKMDYVPFDGNYADGLVSLAKQVASLKNITVSVQQKDTADDLLIDSKAVRKAFQNIVSNAVSFSGESSELKLKFEKTKEAYLVSVTDSGKGFSREGLKKATQKFYSENKARNGVHYGLGLSIAEKIMREHSGFVKIRNVEEKSRTAGAEVSLVFPAGGSGTEAAGEAAADDKTMRKKAEEE